MCGPRRRVREARGDGAGALTPATEEKRSICEVCCSATKSCPILCDPLNCSMLGSPSFSISQSLLKLMSVESVMPSSRLVLCRPLLLLPPIPPSIRVFSDESTLRMRWPKYWSFSFSISPSDEHPGLISFRMDWLDLFSVQGTLKSSSPTPQFSFHPLLPLLCP